MWYREPINMKNIIDSKEYNLISVFDETITKNYNHISLDNNIYSTNISLTP
jgi:hypothetical protein